MNLPLSDRSNQALPTIGRPDCCRIATLPNGILKAFWQPPPNGGRQTKLLKESCVWQNSLEMQNRRKTIDLVDSIRIAFSIKGSIYQAQSEFQVGKIVLGKDGELLSFELLSFELLVDDLYTGLADMGVFHIPCCTHIKNAYRTHTQYANQCGLFTSRCVCWLFGSCQSFFTTIEIVTI